jgi:DNA-binding MarR family transcriptional regulator
VALGRRKCHVLPDSARFWLRAQPRSTKAHARILRSLLTTKGIKLLAKSDPAIEAIQEQILADVPGRERAIVLRAMISAMGKLSARLDR